MNKNNTLFFYKNHINEIERELAIMLGKVTHHIHPEIVSFISEKNEKYKAVFKKLCGKACPIDAFFYPNSDCVFPGTRRPVNNEISEKNWKNNVYHADGTILNDNTYPRHIWTYLAMNKGYSGGGSGSWGESGLSQFELAHVFAHKQDERQLEKKTFSNFKSSVKPYGMFTSASNVVLIPKGLAKPTDGLESVQKCFFKRHLELYGHNMPGLGKFDEALIPEWYGNIKWLPYEAPRDWERRITNLLNYREEHLVKKYVTEC